jgi:hypothetical protein
MLLLPSLDQPHHLAASLHEDVLDLLTLGLEQPA